MASVNIDMNAVMDSDARMDASALATTMANDEDSESSEYPNCIGQYGHYTRCNTCKCSKDCRQITVPKTEFDQFSAAGDFAA